MKLHYAFAVSMAVTLALSPDRAVHAQASMQTLLTNGPTASRLNIVFLSEGYTTDDLVNFPSHASAMLKAFLTTPPLSEYSNSFNAFAISVPSNQSGSDHYTPTMNLVDTYFNSRYDTSGIQRLLTIDATGHSRVNALLAQFMPEYDIVALVVNDTQYGGSGGVPLIASINNQSAQIATHELGHSFAGLGDEYSEPDSAPAERPNATAQTNLDLIKWRAWIQDGISIPTPDVSSNFNVVGLFRGAMYSTNYFRPKHNCKMRTLGVPFCDICAEALVKAIYTQLRPIQGFSPATNQVVSLTNGLPAIFALTNLVPANHSLTVQWLTNNLAVPDATSAVFTVSGFDLAAGTSLSAQVVDPTSLVRNDPSGVLGQPVKWSVSPVVVAPAISIASVGAQANLSWPALAAGFNLEQTAALPANPGWNPLLLISNQTGLSVPITNWQSYFRLHRPAMQ